MSLYINNITSLQIMSQPIICTWIADACLGLRCLRQCSSSSSSSFSLGLVGQRLQLWRQGLGFRVQRLGFRLQLWRQGLGFRVQGLGCSCGVRSSSPHFQESVATTYNLVPTLGNSVAAPYNSVATLWRQIIKPTFSTKKKMALEHQAHIFKSRYIQYGFEDDGYVLLMCC